MAAYVLACGPGAGTARLSFANATATQTSRDLGQHEDPNTNQHALCTQVLPTKRFCFASVLVL